MRVMQLIDSLNAGGAERMAVTFANALESQIEASHLCVTREEGVLKETLHPEVFYLFLNKQQTLDLTAFKKLKKYVKEHKIDIIHAHTTSYFLAAWVKTASPGLKLIWHEHHGNRINQGRKGNLALFLASYKFNAIITVNEALRLWCEEHLKTQQVFYLPNFVLTEETIRPPGERSNTIICVANLRKPKNHMGLLEAFKIVHESHVEWQLVLVGKIFEDDYSSQIRNYISKNNLGTFVELLGERPDIMNLLQNAKIGVLSSTMEGLPVALLEYGAASLAVVVTDVGHCEEVVGNHGKVVPPNDPEALARKINYLIENEMERNTLAENFSAHIGANYGLTSVLSNLLTLYKKSSH